MRNLTLRVVAVVAISLAAVASIAAERRSPQQTLTSTW